MTAQPPDTMPDSAKDFENPAQLTLVLASPDETTAFAARLASQLQAGDTLLLSGPIGAGKTHFARAVIQTRLKASGLVEDVPSPTFTLVQTYQADELEIWHADLSRLGDGAEADELGLHDAFDYALCLVEWPDRLGRDVPGHRLDLTFQTLPQAEHRQLSVTAHGGGWAHCATVLSGDAYA